ACTGATARPPNSSKTNSQRDLQRDLGIAILSIATLGIVTPCRLATDPLRRGSTPVRWWPALRLKDGFARKRAAGSPQGASLLRLSSGRPLRAGPVGSLQ